MNAIEKLQAERQILVERLTEIDKILGRYQEIQRMAESYFAAKESHTQATDSASEPVPFSEVQHLEPTKPLIPMPAVHKPKTPMADFERAVVEVLSEADEPLDRSALYKALMGRDVVIGSPDEKSDLNTLSARMSRMKEKVVNVSGFGYWLRQRDFPAGGYQPMSDRDSSLAGEYEENDSLL